MMIDAINTSRECHLPGVFESALEGKYMLGLIESPTSFSITTPTSKRSYVVGRCFTCFRRPATSLKIEIRDVPASNTYVELGAEWLEERFDEAGITASTLDPFTEHTDPVLMRIGERLREAQSRYGAGSLGAQVLGEALVRHLIGRHAPNKHDGTFLKPSRLRSVIAYIDSHLSDDLSLEDLAAIAGLSRFEFARTFAQETGVPPHRYVMLRRTEAAMAMIREDTMRLSEVGAATGFYDQAHMTRWISRELRLSPKKLQSIVVKEASIGSHFRI